MSGRTKIEWADIPGFPGYQVDREGRILGRTGRLMKAMRNESGHLYVIARRFGKGRKLFIHRAVLYAFVGPCPAGQEGRHLDGNPEHNNIDNLQWGTRLENANDCVLHGHRPRGQAAGGRLTEAVVHLICLSSAPSRVLARMYGVSHTTIQKVRRGERYGSQLED